MSHETHKRTIAKTISWRIAATAVAFVVLVLYTGRIELSFDNAILVGIVNTLVYYLHERVWLRVKWGVRQR